MMCSVYKWFVSSTLDTGKPLPGFVSKHLSHCHECHTFASHAGHLHHTLANDTPTFLKEFSHQEFAEKIISGLPARVSMAGSSKGSRAHLFKPGVFFNTAAISFTLNSSP